MLILYIGWYNLYEAGKEIRLFDQSEASALKILHPGGKAKRRIFLFVVVVVFFHDTTVIMPRVFYPTVMQIPGLSLFFVFVFIPCLTKVN